MSAPDAADPEMIAALFTANREKGYDVVLQDCFGQLDFSAYDNVRVLHMPSMVRPAMPLPQVRLPPGGSIERAMSEDTLAEAERTIVDGMPQRSFQPYQRGQMLPPSLVHSPSWRIWLARIDNQPVGATCTYDDGEAIGVYWVATVPEQRLQGIARGLMGTALGAYPDRPATLLATEAGRPLYESMGFDNVGEVTWVRSIAS